MIDEEELLEKEIMVQAKEEAAANRKLFESELSNIWGYSEAGLESKSAAISMLNTKTGMYSRVPILCKAEDCPYAESCRLLDYNLAPKGEPCPTETSQIELRTREYWNEFDLDNGSFTDKNLVASIVNADIMIERCIGLISKEQNPVQDVVVGVTESGRNIYRPEISKAYEALERAQKRRNELYSLMMATRKDKSRVKDSNDNSNNNISDIINITSEEENS